MKISSAVITFTFIFYFQRTKEKQRSFSLHIFFITMYIESSNYKALILAVFLLIATSQRITLIA